MSALSRSATTRTRLFEEARAGGEGERAGGQGRGEGAETPRRDGSRAGGFSSAKRRQPTAPQTGKCHIFRSFVFY